MANIRETKGWTVRIEFTVPCVPVAQPRQRHRVIKKDDGTTFSTNYTPSKHPVQAFKAAVQLAAAGAYSGQPFDGAIFSRIKFVMPRPATKPTWIKKGTHHFSAWKAGLRVPHIGKPDRDNLMKSLQDALNQLLFRDDSLLYDGPVSKWIAAENEQPHVSIVIETL
jgi:Holliday junction resolvase RusA-like endonuclease